MKNIILVLVGLIFKNQSIIEFLDPYTGPLICLDKTLGMKCVAHFQIVRFMIRVPKETFNVYIYTLSRIFRYLVCFSEQINCCDLLKVFFYFILFSDLPSFI